MEKMIDVPNMSHIIKLNERKNIIISGIKKINNFDDKEFSLDSYIKIDGNHIKVTINIAIFFIEPFAFIIVTLNI